MSQPARPPQLDHTSTVYLAVTHDPARLPHASSASPGSDAGAGSALPVHVELTTPSARSVDVSLAHAGQVGALKDVQLYGLPRAEWEGLGEEGRKEVVESVRGLEGVKSVEVQVLRQRTKRDEF